MDEIKDKEGEESLFNFMLNKEVANKFKGICKLEGTTFKDKLTEMIIKENEKTVISRKENDEEPTEE